MTAFTVQLDLMEFVEQNILPRYNNLDKAHSMQHAMRVVKRSLELANKVGANADMAYVVAAYHDLGLEGPRAIHHITGGKILASDARLRKWFSAEQIKIMKEAIEDHRASSSHSPRSIYGKIVAEADRDLDPEIVFGRTIEYGLDHYPEKNKEQQWQRFAEHMKNKYGNNGYIKLWIAGSQNEKWLKELREIISDRAALRRKFDSIYQTLSSEQGI